MRTLTGEYSSIAKKARDVSNTQMHYTDYYEDRGRKGVPKKHLNNKMGLMLKEQSKYEESLPSSDVAWVPDAKTQEPNLISSYTSDLILNDVPYIAGPSGMTNLFCGLMFALDIHKSKEEKQIYILCFLVYIVAGGFHSMHEVLGPIDYCLRKEDLIPNYNATLTRMTKQARPPPYKVFFSIINKMDLEFEEKYNTGWIKFLSFFKNEYLPLQNRLKLHKNFELDLRDTICNDINQYKNTLSKLATFHDKELMLKLNNYEKLLIDSDSFLRQYIIIMILFIDNDLKKLIKKISNNLDYEESFDLKNLVKLSFHQHLTSLVIEKYGDTNRLNDIKQNIGLNLVAKIKDLIDKNKPYINRGNAGEYSEPLEELSLIANELKTKTSSPKSPSKKI